MKGGEEKMMIFHLGYRNLNPVKFLLFEFADDMVVLANNDVDLPCNVSVLEKELSKVNLTINFKKTKVMGISKKKIEKG